MLNWIVYIVRCNNNSFYCGITNNIEKRLAAHNNRRGAKYTRSRLPVVLIATSRLMSKSDALKLEYQVKQQKTDMKINYLRKFV